MMFTMSGGSRNQTKSSASAQGLCDFIDASPSPFHVCATVAARLIAAGYTELSEAERWPSQPGRYFTVRSGSLVAWNSEGADGPFRIVGETKTQPKMAPGIGQHTAQILEEFGAPAAAQAAADRTAAQ